MLDGENTIGFAILIWLAELGILAVLSFAGVYQYALVQLLAAGLIGYIAFRFSTKRVTHSFLTVAVWLGIVWGVAGAVLDGAVTAYFLPGILNNWGLWLGHFLVLLGPIVHYEVDYKKKKKADPRYHPFKT